MSKDISIILGKGKLDKVSSTGHNRVYGVNSSGEQAMYQATAQPTPETIVMRNPEGKIHVEDGTNSTEAVNFRQLDKKYDKSGGEISGDVTIKGKTKVQTAPKDNDDVTRKGDFKTINGNSLLGSGDLTIAGSDDKLDKQTAQTESDQVYGKLADGSQTMFDVTMGATATTIPRRDTAGRIQVADGVSGNDAVNFNQLQAVESSISGLNIQNGSGVKSIQQGADPKYNGVIKAASKNPYAKVLYPELTDAEPLGAIGDYAASFGGNSSVQAKRGIGGGTSSVTKGAYSQSLGDNTVTTPKASDSTAIGYQTTTDAPGAFTHGSFTVVMSQKYIEGMFDPNIEPGQGGSGQPTEPGTMPTDTLEMDNRRGEAASAGGFNSYSSGFAAETDGVSNVADGHISKSSGRSNRSWSYLSKTDGKNSVVKPDPTNADATGEGSWANGDNIQIIGAKYAYSGGNNNIVFAGADNSFSYGEGLQVKHKNQVVIGQYNDSSDSTNNDLFVVGAGTGNSNRKNAIRVTEDGKLYYGDFEVSNLKTTNDAIVSLDNELTPKITGNTTEITKLWSTLRDTNTNLNRLNETKQATLVSGTNIKTINGNSLLGSGDLVIESGGTEVTPNPTLSGSEAALSALQIGDTKYRIEGTLTTLMVGIDSSLLGG